MHALETPTTASGAAFWNELVAQADALVSDEPDFIANAANVSSLVYHLVPALNWVGVYLLKDGGLVVGPFQGRPACVRIPLGNGVCGTAAAERRTIVVDDVDAFPGHIACDAVSRSEIVVPLLREGELIGVLDVDSPVRARFTGEDRVGLERIAALLTR